MGKTTDFLKTIRTEFPDDRLTFQKHLATFHPESADEAARLFKMAGTDSQRVYITGFGNNIDPGGERFADMVVVRSDRLNHIHQISETDLYVKVGGGYPLREINKELESHQLFTPHSALPYVGSTGGAVAVNLSAELNGHDLPIRKFFLQAEIATPEGEIVTPGSVCFKSVSGYDVVKIYAASWGLLGMIVSVTLRVVPLTAADEYAAMKMKAIDRQHFLTGIDESSDEADAIYSRKIKAKFDPRGVLPVV
jgi:FAD/FMN-containing dehydrogenase